LLDRRERVLINLTIADASGTRLEQIPVDFTHSLHA
jgi:hypothetical protein